MKPLATLLTLALAGAAIIWCPTVTLSLPLGQDLESVGDRAAAPGPGTTGPPPSAEPTQAPMMTLTRATPREDGDLPLAEASNHGEPDPQRSDPQLPELAPLATRHAGPTP